MELHTAHIKAIVTRGHDLAFIVRGSDGQFGRDGCLIDDPRMVAACFNPQGNVPKKQFVRLKNVHRNGNPMMHLIKVLQRGPECFANGLMAETNAQNLLGGCVALDECGHDTRVLRQSRAGRKNDGIELFHFVQRQLIIAPHRHIIAELLHVMHEIEREAVVVVEDEEFQ